MAERDEFYVGYASRAPGRVASRTRATVTVILAAAMTAAATLAAVQGPIDPGTFEFGVDREFRGVIVERPYPMLLVASGQDRFESHLLTAFGKRGAAREVAGLNGKAVRVTGSRIANDRDRMIEVHAVEPWDDRLAGGLEARLSDAERDLGTFTLTGEIVDSKCHLGVMKPGRGRGHRACAILCIRGGVPPVLRVEGASGGVDLLLLVDAAGEPVNDRVLDRVAEPVEITGRVTLRGDRLVMYADPDGYTRAGAGR